MIYIKNDLSASEAVKVDSLCARILGDLGSIHSRVSPEQADGRVKAMSSELISLRRQVRELQDSVRDLFPSAFFK